MEQIDVRQTIIQSMTDGTIQRVLKNELCYAKFISSFSKLTEENIFYFEKTEQSMANVEPSLN